MRELYNCFFMMKNSKNQFILKNIILHPEDYKYSASLSLNYRNRIIYNRIILSEMDKKNLNIYPNQNARNETLGKEASVTNFFPFPIEKNKNKTSSKKINPKEVQLLTISRFVSFKIATTISLITFVKKNKKFTLNIVGYGPWKFLLKIILFFHHTNRINIYPKQNLEDLELFIKKCDIGFAQGTTILQIAKFKKPVIVMPYSKWYDFIFNEIKSPQVFGDTKSPNFGDMYYKRDMGYFKYDYLIKKILPNYDDYIIKTEKILSNLESDKIFSDLLSKLRDVKYYDEFLEIRFPKPSFLKYCLRKVLSRS